jgi:hypothetical protein
LSAFGARFATSSSGGSVAELCIIGTPNSPGGLRHRRDAAVPEQLQPADRRDEHRQAHLAAEQRGGAVDVRTLRSTRGLNAIESSDWRLRASVVSVSVPPVM